MSDGRADEMEVLAAASTSVQYQGEELVISPLAVGLIPSVVRELRPVVAGLRSAGSADLALEFEISPELVMDLITDHSGALFAATAICAGRDVEFVKKGDAAEFIGLVLKVVEVNRDFFTRQISPLLAGLRTRIPGVGPMPSSS